MPLRYACTNLHNLSSCLILGLCRAGRLMARAELQAAPMARFAGVGTCCLEAAGPDRLLVADSRGCLHLYSAEPRGGQLAQLAHFPAPSGRFHEPACLEFAGHSALAGGPAVLLALSSGEVLLLRLHEKVGGVGWRGVGLAAGWPCCWLAPSQQYTAACAALPHSHAPLPAPRCSPGGWSSSARCSRRSRRPPRSAWRCARARRASSPSCCWRAARTAGVGRPCLCAGVLPAGGGAAAARCLPADTSLQQCCCLDADCCLLHHRCLQFTWWTSAVRASRPRWWRACRRTPRRCWAWRGARMRAGWPPATSAAWWRCGSGPPRPPPPLRNEHTR